MSVQIWRNKAGDEIKEKRGKKRKEREEEGEEKRGGDEIKEKGRGSNTVPKIYLDLESHIS